MYADIEAPIWNDKSSRVTVIKHWMIRLHPARAFFGLDCVSLQRESMMPSLCRHLLYDQRILTIVGRSTSKARFYIKAQYCRVIGGKKVIDIILRGQVVIDCVLLQRSSMPSPRPPLCAAVCYMTTEFCLL
ncbi:hypothetical protein ElyMa_001229200 [Elysia marginata]|uniref:Uncharacterized protein n=1 Tax=Elysia marginata TaxID=1093978 RepID=A0AAV4I855_9GAST|nr:hypothetical protein ElyMa_001229200 [Elysia marginata]